MATTRSSTLRAASLAFCIAAATAPLVDASSLAHGSNARRGLGDFVYQGCYTDQGDNRVLADKVIGDDKLTLRRCAAECVGYNWFGVENGSGCYCGTSLSADAEKRPEEECSVKCAGSNCQTCGGADRINVFSAISVPGSSSAVPPESSTSTFEDSTTISEPPSTETTFTVPPQEETTSAPATTVTTSTTAPCSLTTTFAPATCWASIPTACSSLSRSPAIPYPAVTVPATNCRNSFIVGPTPIPEIASCFTNANSPSFQPMSAYSCVASAHVYCRSSVVCATTTDAAGNPLPTSGVTVDNGGFEAGRTWPLDTSSGADSVLGVAVSADRSHSGNYALKGVFDNTSGASRTYRQLVFWEPGATYEASWWWWSENSQASTTSRMQISGAGLTFLHDAPTFGGPTGQWVRTSKTFTPTASFGDVRFTMYGNQQGGANTFYVDDIEFVKLS